MSMFELTQIIIIHTTHYEPTITIKEWNVSIQIRYESGVQEYKRYDKRDASQDDGFLDPNCIIVNRLGKSKHVSLQDIILDSLVIPSDISFSTNNYKDESDTVNFATSDTNSFTMTRSKKSKNFRNTLKDRVL